MPASCPVAGYPSITAAAAALARQGLGETEIARRLDVKVKTVSTVLYRVQQRGMTLRLPHDAADGLATSAEARGVTLEDLACRVLEAVARDGLLDAVLDDGDDGSGA